jgi:hypothetical protein
VGQEVYKLLFGCGSILDPFKDDPTSVYAGLVAAGVSPVSAAVQSLQALYQTARGNQADMQLFIDSLTQRPKATFVDVLGLPELSPDLSEDDLLSITRLEAAGLSPNGFFSTAVDPEAPEMSNDKFTATTTSTTLRSTTEPVVIYEERINADTGKTFTVARTSHEPREEVVTVKKTEQGSYNLRDDLNERQLRVKAYVDSLALRGLRG